MSIALGIDCATKSGWALAERAGGKERVLEAGVLDLSGKHGGASQLISSFTHWLAQSLSLNGLPVAIELPYLGENAHALLVLARLCGRWEQALGVYGAAVELVTAQHWQRKILGAFGGQKRADRKKAAMLWARAAFGRQFKEDEADAVGITICMLRERDMDAVIERAKRISGDKG